MPFQRRDKVQTRAGLAPRRRIQTHTAGSREVLGCRSHTRRCGARVGSEVHADGCIAAGQALRELRDEHEPIVERRVQPEPVHRPGHRAETDAPRRGHVGRPECERAALPARVHALREQGCPALQLLDPPGTHGRRRIVPQVPGTDRSMPREPREHGLQPGQLRLEHQRVRVLIAWATGLHHGIAEHAHAGSLAAHVDGVRGEHDAVTERLREQHGYHPQRLARRELEHHVEVAQLGVVDRSLGGHERIPGQERAHEVVAGRSDSMQLRAGSRRVELVPDVWTHGARPVRHADVDALAHLGGGRAELHARISRRRGRCRPRP